MAAKAGRAIIVVLFLFESIRTRYVLRLYFVVWFVSVCSRGSLYRVCFTLHEGGVKIMHFELGRNVQVFAGETG